MAARPRRYAPMYLFPLPGALTIRLTFTMEEAGMRSFRWAAIASILALVAAATAQTVPAGTPLQVRIIESLSSDKSRAGETFHGTLAEPLVVNGRTMFPQGTDVTGTVTKAHPSGRLSDPGVLELTLNSLTTGSGSYPISASPVVLKGESHTKSNVTKIGGGAAVGAVLGGIFGGGKGAAIGAGAGAAAGTGVAAATGKKDSKVESEAILTWTTSQPIALAGSMRRGPQGSRSFNDPRGPQGRQRISVGAQPLEEFSDADRQNIRSCFESNNSGLPPGLAKRDRLPPGLERQVQRNGTLPPGLQRRVQPLPDACAAGLPRLPADWSRVILGRRVLLLNGEQRILDLFSLDQDQ